MEEAEDAKKMGKLMGGLAALVCHALAENEKEREACFSGIQKTVEGFSKLAEGEPAPSKLRISLE
jgi:hypothetical protein